MASGTWQFFVDVGGTFTDVVARRPDGRLVTHKLLSSGAVRGVVEPGSTQTCIKDNRRIGDPKDFWVGYRLSIVDCGLRIADYQVTGPNRQSTIDNPQSTIVRAFDSHRGRLFLETPLGLFSPLTPPYQGRDGEGCTYELQSEEEAPVLAIRWLMGIGLKRPIGPVDVRLGTTRATNALLERKGAKVVLVTTKGFADVLKIGNQDRPALFELNIRKRDELTTLVVEIDERMSAQGKVLRAPNEGEVRKQLEEARALGVETVAVCLLHSYVNPIHEKKVAVIARSVGFSHVSVSSRVARMEKMVPRGDTTVVDAYLAPVIRDYVSSLRRSMPEARLTFMTSNGGLVDASGASGKDCVLSGPAGGVVGCAHVARAAGFDKTIGFDMGGTSTDVSRIDPPPHKFEYQYETIKAGVRIMAPMLAVETVAAGGGSICAFDGQKLTVGPRSAGAVPGPASYGRGGPLTLTDMNVFLGRIPPDYFPFRLDRTIVERRLATLCDEVNAATGSNLGPIELAEGFIKIANANMAAAIKRISIAKGYDVREYALTTFGGAGGQHACAIATALGISRVVCSPFAGVLSALGIGVANRKRIGQRSVCQLLDAEASRKLEPVFGQITEELRHRLFDEGADPATLLPPVRTLDLCYAGQATPITVPAPAFGGFEQVQARFEAMHRQLYGYDHEGRAIEIRAVRVELTARSEQLETRAGLPGAECQRTARTAEMVVDGKRRSVPLYHRSELSAGQRISGPAILMEETSTVVMEPGWAATVHETGDIVLTDTQAVPAHERVSTQVDPIQLELFNNQFAAAAEQMGTTLRRTALSTNVKERLDFSCAIFTPRGDLVVNAPHIPVHLGGMSDCVKALMEDVGRFSPGDVYITNDPYRGGSHLNDVTVITPVHDEEGKRIEFFVASRAHHAEIGGTRPGSMPPDSTSLAEEGVLIRAFPWIQDGKPQQRRLRDLLTRHPYPSRTPDENLADIAAQVAANQTGVREIQRMIARYGIEVVHSYMLHIQTAAERKMRNALGKLPPGLHRFEDRLDDGSPIRLTVKIEGDHATLDFSGTGPVLTGNLNANRAIVTSAVLYCFRCLIDEDIPLNAGVLAPIEIILPDCFLNPLIPSFGKGGYGGVPDPKVYPAVAGGNVETSQRVVDCIFGALQTVAASQGTMNNLLIGNDRASPSLPAFGYYETICGGAGAGPGFDGADAVHTHMTNTRLTDPEVLERQVPLRIVRFAIRHGSGGRGRYRGGCGVIRELEFLEPLEVSILSQRRTTAPYGLCGGESGQSGRNLLRRCGSHEAEVLPPFAQTSVQPGDRLIIETPGGGGWGKSKSRNVEKSK